MAINALLCITTPPLNAMLRFNVNDPPSMEIGFIGVLVWVSILK
jgi:hypothetical protein